MSEYTRKAVEIIGADFKYEVGKLIREFLKKYPVLEGIRVPFFDIFVKDQGN